MGSNHHRRIGICILLVCSFLIIVCGMVSWYLQRNDKLTLYPDTQTRTATNKETVYVKTALHQYVQKTTPKQEVVIALIDSGVDRGEPILKDRIWGNGYDLTGIYADERDPNYQNGLQDYYGHGTMLATLIAEESNSNVKILPITVVNASGKTTQILTEKAIRLAIAEQVDIINISLSARGKGNDKRLQQAIIDATNNGIEVVVSAGNYNTDTADVLPAYIEEAIVVAATDEQELRAEYSDYGTSVDYCAYGDFQDQTGTSCAAARFSAILGDVISRGGSLETVELCAIDYGERGRDSYYGNGYVGWQVASDIDTEGVIGENWKNSNPDYNILFLKDAANVSDEELNHYIMESDLADVGYYLSTLSEQQKNLLLKRDTLLNKVVTFYSGNVSGKNVANSIAGLTKKQTMPYYEKCMQQYALEEKVLRVNDYYLHRTGYINLTFLEDEGNQEEITYQIYVRVCKENYALTGSASYNGKVMNRSVVSTSNKPNFITVWSMRDAGISNWCDISLTKIDGAYASFLTNEKGEDGKVFVPNLEVTCPGYYLMYTAEAKHAVAGKNCEGRINFYKYDRDNTYIQNYQSNREEIYLRKSRMDTEETTVLIRPQIDTSHMNLGTSASGFDSAIDTFCTMYIYLNKPKVTLTIIPGEGMWRGNRQTSQISVVNTKTEQIGPAVISNHQALFCGNGDMEDPVEDITISTSCVFDHWELSLQPQEGKEFGDTHSYMQQEVFYAGNMEYDQNSEYKPTIGEYATLTAVYSGSQTITFPQAPSREGYTFLGWFDGNEETSKQVCAPEATGIQQLSLQEDVIFYAKWQKNVYEISFYNGKECVGKRNLEYKTLLDLTNIRKQEEDGQVWYEQSLIGVDSIYVSNTQYICLGWSQEEDGDLMKEISVPANDSLTLYAVWSAPTSGMKQVYCRFENGENYAEYILPTNGAPVLNLTLGLRAYSYETYIELEKVLEGQEIVLSKESYAEDYAGNKTSLWGIEEWQGPVRCQFLYQFYTMDVETYEWQYQEGMDRIDTFEGNTGEEKSYTIPQMEESLFEGFQLAYLFYENQKLEKEKLPCEMVYKIPNKMEDGLVTINVYYEPETVAICFDANGGSYCNLPPNKQMQRNDEQNQVVFELSFRSPLNIYPMPDEQLQKEFVGYYTEREGGEAFIAGKSCTGKMTYYAHWQKKTGIVRYCAAINGGRVTEVANTKLPTDQEIVEQEVPLGEVIAYQNVIAEREGYTFLGWSVKEEGVEALLSEELYMEQTDMVLYAQFAKCCDVIFHHPSRKENVCKAFGESPFFYNWDKEKEFVAPIADNYKDYQFIGWICEKMNESQGKNQGDVQEDVIIEYFDLAQGAFFSVSDSMDYYAKYSKTVTITYQLPEIGQSYTEEGKTSFYTYDQTNIPAKFTIAQAPIRRGYKFISWIDEAGKTYESGQLLVVSDNINLWAKWEPVDMQLNLNAAYNGGCLQKENWKIPYGTEVNLSEEAYIPKREGYHFLGWSYTTEYDENQLVEGQHICLDENTLLAHGCVEENTITLYAVYGREISIRFVQWKKDTVIKQTIYNRQSEAVIQVPEIDAKDVPGVARGWSTQKENNAEVALMEKTNVYMESDACYYALYQKLVTLTYDTGVHNYSLPIETGYVYWNAANPIEMGGTLPTFTVRSQIQREGASFINWSVRDDLASVFTASDEVVKKVKPQQQISIVEDVCLQAEWDYAPTIRAKDSYFTLEQATEPDGDDIIQQVLLSDQYVKVSDQEDESDLLMVELENFCGEELAQLTGNTDIQLIYKVTDSVGNVTKTKAFMHIVDSRPRKSMKTAKVRFISPQFYRRGEEYVAEDEGGLKENSIWRKQTAYKEVLDKAMEHMDDSTCSFIFTKKYTKQDIEQIRQNVF